MNMLRLVLPRLRVSKLWESKVRMSRVTTVGGIHGNYGSCLLQLVVCGQSINRLINQVTTFTNVHRNLSDQFLKILNMESIYWETQLAAWSDGCPDVSSRTLSYSIWCQSAKDHSCISCQSCGCRYRWCQRCAPRLLRVATEIGNS